MTKTSKFVLRYFTFAFVSYWQLSDFIGPHDHRAIANLDAVIGSVHGARTTPQMAEAQI